MAPRVLGPLTLFASACLAACSPSPAQPDADADAASRDDASSALDAADDASPDAGACNALDPADAPLVLPTAATGTPAPATGGALVDGLYALDSVVYYFASPDHAELPFPRARQWLEVRGGMLTRATQNSLGAIARTAATYRTTDATLYTTPVCPVSGPEQSVEYSATADALVLLAHEDGAASASVSRFVRR